jgi:hypothetical protein
MHIFVLTATYELRVSRKSHLRDHPKLSICTNIRFRINVLSICLAMLAYAALQSYKASTLSVYMQLIYFLYVRKKFDLSMNYRVRTIN